MERKGKTNLAISKALQFNVVGKIQGKTKYIQTPNETA